VTKAAVSYPLDARSLSELNTILNGSDLASCVADPSSRVALVTLNAAVLPEGWRPQVLYPLVIALHPVGRVAASHRVSNPPTAAARGGPASLRPLALPDLDQVIGTFASHWIYDWDPIDPPEEVRFRWRDAISLDAQWGHERAHMLDLWQDDGPGHTLDLGLWFDNLYLFDAELRSVTSAVLAGWRRRYEEELRRGAAGGGTSWVTSPAVVRASPDAVLERIESTG
jgi:hypothetical protein